jgi:hypothetical protein
MVTKKWTRPDMAPERAGEGGHPLRAFHPLSWGLITAPLWYQCEGCAIPVHRPVGLLDARPPPDQFCSREPGHACRCG